MKGSVKKSGSNWYYVVDLGIDPATGKRQQRKKRGFATRKEAEAALAETLGRVVAGTVTDDLHLTLAAYLQEHWLPARKSTISPKTFDGYRRIVEDRIVPRLGALRLTRITPKQIEQWIDWLLREGCKDPRRGPGLEPRTVRTSARVLKSALADAVKRGLIPRNPADVVSMPKVVDKEMTSWTPEECRRFLAAVSELDKYGKPDRDVALWTVILAAGLRRGEVLGLQWKDVDFEHCRISVVRTIVESEYRVSISEPKTEKSKRTFHADDGLLAILKSHRVRQQNERSELGLGFLTRDDWIFSKPTGEHYHPQHISQRFDRLVEKHGLRRIRLHDLRHTSATLLLADGVPLKVVSERLGHSSITITADTYQHVLPSMDKDAANRMGSILFGS